MSRFVSRFREKPRDITWLIVGISTICALGFLINTQNPDYVIPLVIFFLLLFIAAFSLTFYITNIVRRSILVGGGVFVFFLLRFLGLRDWYYVLLLGICLIFVELSSQNR